MEQMRAEQVGAAHHPEFVMILPFLIAVASLADVAPPAVAATAPVKVREKTTTTDTYRVHYDVRRNVYCIRLFGESVPAEPYPGPSRDTCKSRAKWAKEGLTISDPRRDATKS